MFCRRSLRPYIAKYRSVKLERLKFRKVCDFCSDEENVNSPKSYTKEF